MRSVGQPNRSVCRRPPEAVISNSYPVESSASRISHVSTSALRSSSQITYAASKVDEVEEATLLPDTGDCFLSKIRRVHDNPPRQLAELCGLRTRTLTRTRTSRTVSGLSSLSVMK